MGKFHKKDQLAHGLFISARDTSAEVEEINPLIISIESYQESAAVESGHSKKKNKKHKHKSPIKSLKPLLRSLPVNKKKDKTRLDDSFGSSLLDYSDNTLDKADVLMQRPPINMFISNKDSGLDRSSGHSTSVEATDEMINFAQFDTSETDYQSIPAPPPLSRVEDVSLARPSEPTKKICRANSASTISDTSINSARSFWGEFKSKLPGSPFRNTRKRSGKVLWGIVRSRISDINMMRLNSLDEEDSSGDIGESIEDGLDIKLIYCIYGIALYLLVGTLFYSVVFETWSVVDSLYFSVVTFTTVGYGDFYPTSHMARLFTSIFSMVGISFLGLALGVIGNKVIEMKLDTVAKEMSEQNAHAVFQAYGVFSKSCLDLTFGENENSKVEGSLVTPSLPFRFIHALCQYLPAIAFVAGGSIFIAWFEGWNWSQAFYYGTMTTTTVGYGDLVPTTSPMRLFAIFYIPVSVAIMGNILGSVAGMVMDMKRERMLQSIRHRRLRVKDLLAMDEDGDGNVTELEYTKFMLLKMQKVDEDLLEELHKQFSHFDADNSGVLAKSDLYEMAKRRSKEPSSKLRLSGYKSYLLRQADAKKRRNRGKPPKASKGVSFTSLSASVLEKAPLNRSS